MWPPPIPSKCPRCDDAVTVFNYGTMAGCKTHGVVVDNRPADTKARERREQDDVRWRASRAHLPPIEIFRGNKQ